MSRSSSPSPNGGSRPAKSPGEKGPNTVGEEPGIRARIASRAAFRADVRVPEKRISSPVTRTAEWRAKLSRITPSVISTGRRSAVAGLGSGTPVTVGEPGSPDLTSMMCPLPKRAPRIM